MQIEILAAESLGTRSMATWVKTEDITILIDPGVALGPNRFGLSPHREEIVKLKEHWEHILKKAQTVQVIFLTHYHFDHYNPHFPLMFKDKELYLKNPEEKINASQKMRASYFLSRIKDLPQKLTWADDKQFSFGKTRIRTSPPVFHGASPELGYVIQILIEDQKERFLFTSDIEGPQTEEQLRFISGSDPHILYLDGPMSYLQGKTREIKKGVENILRILESDSLKTLILDHHLLRDFNWRVPLQDVFRAAGRCGIKITSAAEFMVLKENLLEARRKELYK